MLRILICAVILFACATSSKTVTRDVHDCVYLGLIDGGSRSEVVSETQTMGPSHVIWVHPPEVVRGYLVESNRSLYSCPSPRPAAASFKQGLHCRQGPPSPAWTNWNALPVRAQGILLRRSRGLEVGA